MKHAIKLWLLTALLAAHTAACTATVGEEGAPDHGTDESSIRNGTKSSWGKAIVALRITHADGRIGRCTGTFITRFDVLTAAHCVNKVSEGGWLATKVEVSFGATWSGTRYRAKDFVVHPESWDNWTVPVDMALVRFRDPQDVEAFPVADFDMPAGSFLGQQVVMAGYGLATENPDSGAGTKRWAYGQITRNNGAAITVLGLNGADTLGGDSGGPIVVWNGAQWVVVGVLYGGRSYSMPTAQRDFIERYLSIGGIIQP